MGPRRAVYMDVGCILEETGSPLSADDLGHFETLDLVYRSLCALLFNYLPTSGHPGGSISSGRIEVLPLLDRAGLDPWVHYVASTVLFDLLPPERQRALLPEEPAWEAMGITGFTLPTMFDWVRSVLGRQRTLHPFQHGRFLGSGQGEAVLAEAGLGDESRHRAIKRYAEARRTAGLSAR